VIDGYLMFFSSTEAVVLIERIFHGARDMTPDLFDV